MKIFSKRVAALCTGTVLAVSTLGIGLTAGAVDDTDLRPDVNWLTSYGSSYSVSAVLQSAGGGYITAGSTDSSTTSANAYIAEFNASGTKTRETTYAGVMGANFYDIKSTSDGGYIAAGACKLNDSPLNVVPVIVKYDESGDKQWDKKVSGEDCACFSAVIITSDGGYVVAGSVFQNETNANDALIVKYDANGNVVWSKSMGGTDLQKFSSVRQTTDGGYIAAGTFNDTATFVKFTASGDSSSQVSYSGGERSDFNDIRQTADGGYIAVGFKKAEGVNQGYPLIVKYNNSGTKQWEKTVSGIDYAFFSTVMLTADGEFIAAGSTCQNETSMNDALIVKYDASGNVVWSKTLGGTGLENFSDIKQTADGGLVLVGTTSSDDGDFAGKNTSGNSIAFICKLGSIYDKDGDGIPNSRDLYPLDPAKGYDSSQINLGSAPQQQVTGIQSGSAYSGEISFEDYSALPAYSNVEFKLSNVSVIFPVEVLDSQLDGSLTDSLRLSQSASPQSTLNQASLLISSGGSIIGAFDFSLQKISAEGTSESIHQLGGTVKVTISLTDAQVAQLRNGGTPKIYYFNTETNKLEDVNATFDLNAKTVTFYTDHFSTYVIKSGAAATSASPNTGDRAQVLMYFSMLSGSSLAFIYLRRFVKRQGEVV